MRALSIILFIFCGLFLVGASNTFMNNQGESGAFFIGIMIPAASCLILGIVCNSAANKAKAKVKQQTALEQYNTVRRP